MTTITAPDSKAKCCDPMRSQDTRGELATLDMWRPAAAAALIDFCALARWLAAMGPIVCIALGDSIASSSRLPARPEWSSCYREYIPTLSGRRCDASGAHGLAGACQRSPLPVNALGR